MANATYYIKNSGTYGQRSKHPAGNYIPAVVQPPVLTIPSLRWYYGDSQFSGQASGVVTKNSALAFDTLLNAITGGTPTTTIDPAGGLGLQEHWNRLQTRWNQAGEPNPRPGPEFVHFVETGGQTRIGQTNATDYGNTFESFVRWIRGRSPNAIISHETNFSFGRENEAGRNWEPYKAAMLAKVALLEAEGIHVHITDTDGRIKALQQIVGPAAVWYQAGDPLGREYHFTDLGNFMIAMSMLWQFGYDINDLNLTSVLSEGIVTPAQIQACRDVLNGV